jgi:hypothetical protein
VQQLALLRCLHICTAAIVARSMFVEASPAMLLLCGDALSCVRVAVRVAKVRCCLLQLLWREACCCLWLPLPCSCRVS